MSLCRVGRIGHERPLVDQAGKVGDDALESLRVSHHVVRNPVDFIVGDVPPA
ncbi:hypothetical protein CDHC04_0643 [Corynebacterium diphtheriae HC04]|nr:hypothetical protein CDHC04_0643 [Corynebacterium diphtheriae HC04]